MSDLAALHVKINSRWLTNADQTGAIDVQSIVWWQDTPTWLHVGFNGGGSTAVTGIEREKLLARLREML